ncbi:MAG: 1,6-anhydro-N-acetylmuramyl-L-alanine amidase AmpD [Gammaproteobacteria bacterium]|mgnify:CR=1 FL=1|nr:MAG: 1,6-anhydro-N-acetylmuramyl-L-alanine amidase AmpD [Gammaproteobacteria bacterium]
MKLDCDSGWIEGVGHEPSPNCSPRPANSEIELIVIHNISLPPQQYEGCWITDLFLNRLDPEAHPYFQEIAHLEVSAHLLIRREGAIIQYVPFNMAAWHAGQSSFNGKERCNEFSIGIELEGSDFDQFTEKQYETLINITNLLISHYPCIKKGNITGHSDIAPGRKTDPGPYFDWERVTSNLKW